MTMTLDSIEIPPPQNVQSVLVHYTASKDLSRFGSATVRVVKCGEPADDRNVWNDVGQFVNWPPLWGNVAFGYADTEAANRLGSPSSLSYTARVNISRGFRLVDPAERAYLPIERMPPPCALFDSRPYLGMTDWFTAPPMPLPDLAVTLQAPR